MTGVHSSQTSPNYINHLRTNKNTRSASKDTNNYHINGKGLLEDKSTHDNPLITMKTLCTCSAPLVKLLNKYNHSQDKVDKAKKCLKETTLKNSNNSRIQWQLIVITA